MITLFGTEALCLGVVGFALPHLVFADEATEEVEEEDDTMTMIILVLIALGLVWYIKKNKESKTSAPVSTPSFKSGSSNASESTEEGHPMTILYGSQSGTAESFAFELQKEAKHHHFNAKVIDMEDFDHENDLAEQKFVIFLLATFGEGEPTDSCVSFYEWIMDEDLDVDMSGVEFTCFALGNKQYEHYCAIGRRVVKRMKELGAHELLSHGEGDDDGTLDDDYADWKQKMWPIVKETYLDESEMDDGAQEQSFDASYVIEYLDEPATESKTPAVKIDSKHKGGYAKVKEIRELRQDPTSGSTLHIEYDISDIDMTYVTADNLGVHPRNDNKMVHKIAKRLGYDLNKVFKLSPKAGARNPPIPTPISVRDALLWYVDVSALPTRSVLDTLKMYATDPADKEQLIKWTSDDKQAFVEDKKTLLEVLEAVPSVTPPLEEFVEFIPMLQPRFYTISSSSVEDPNIVSATVKVVHDELPRGRFHDGICSTYMSQGKESHQYPLFVRSSTFRPTWNLPKSVAPDHGAQNPMIMVGPGTGLAPFRAFVREAKLRKDKGEEVGRMMLFFGCQKSERDFIYKDELQSIADEGVFELNVALSRETAGKKVYVQHMIAEQGKEVWHLIQEKHAYFYVCGSTSMGKEVREVLCKLAVEHGGMGEKEAQDYLHFLQEHGRYIQELWG